MGHKGLSGRVQGSDDRAGWSHVAMRWLGRITQVVEISVVWFIGTVAGILLFGWLPAAVAASDVLHRLLSEDPSGRPVADFIRAWRAHFRRANLVGWPGTVVMLVLALDFWVLLGFRGPLAGVLLVLTALVSAWFLFAVGFLVNLLALPAADSRTAWDLWRTALTMALVSPGQGLAWLVCLASIGAVVWVFPVTAVLVAPGLIAFITAWLTRRRLHATGVAVDPREG